MRLLCLWMLLGTPLMHRPVRMSFRVKASKRRRARLEFGKLGVNGIHRSSFSPTPTTTPNPNPPHPPNTPSLATISLAARRCLQPSHPVEPSALVKFKWISPTTCPRSCEVEYEQTVKKRTRHFKHRCRHDSYVIQQTPGFLLGFSASSRSDEVSTGRLRRALSITMTAQCSAVRCSTVLRIVQCRSSVGRLMDLIGRNVVSLPLLHLC